MAEQPAKRARVDNGGYGQAGGPGAALAAEPPTSPRERAPPADALLDDAVAEADDAAPSRMIPVGAAPQAHEHQEPGQGQQEHTAAAAGLPPQASPEQGGAAPPHAPAQPQQQQQQQQPQPGSPLPAEQQAQAQAGVAPPQQPPQPQASRGPGAGAAAPDAAAAPEPGPQAAAPAGQPPAAAPPQQVPTGAYTQREEHLQRQEASGDIEFVYVVNDGTPTNMIRLMGLKVIFSKQLPNMPREYICRLLLDRRHRSCALVARSGAVLGGITYRVFPQQGFGEIAFCAVAASQQVRGFGTRLMNHTKALARDRDGLTHFLTYADNNAVGYFQKQGFTREVTLPRERWVGFIKDYDGGTLMECAIHPRVPHTDLVGLFRVQREYLDSQIRRLSNSHVVHPGVTRQRMPMPGPPHARVKALPVPLGPGDIPGVKEAGWSADAPGSRPNYRLLLKDAGWVDPTPAHLQRYMADLLSLLQQLDEAWPFRAPVDPAEALDYYDVILDPVDLSLVAGRLAARGYYVGLEMFVADVRKMCDNCRYYNAATTPYYQCAVKLQAAMEAHLSATVVEAPPAAAQQQ